MGISTMNTDGAGAGAGAGSGGATDRAATNLQARPEKKEQSQLLKSGGAGTEGYVPQGDKALASGAKIIRLTVKDDRKGDGAATNNRVSEKPDTDAGKAQSDTGDQKMAAIKEQIADLLATIEALIPTFAKKVQSQIETTASDDKINNAAENDAERDALVAALEELAQMLDEIIQYCEGLGDSDQPSDNEAEAIPNDYATDEERQEEANEQTSAEAVDVFMSIYDQLSDSTQREVANILASMTFGDEDQLSQSGGSDREDRISENYGEFLDLVAQQGETENTPILNIDIAGMEVQVADEVGLAFIEEPIVMDDGQHLTDGAILEVGDSGTLSDGRILTFDRNISLSVEDPEAGLQESITWESPIEDSGADSASSNQPQNGNNAADNGQTGDSSDPAEGGAQSGADAASSTGTGSDTSSQNDTNADADSSGGDIDSSDSVGSADVSSGIDDPSHGTLLDHIGVNGYYLDGIITVQEPVVVGGQLQNGAELQPGDQVVLANGDILTFNDDGAGCRLRDVSAGIGRAINFW
jgi:hypothetical protein